MTPETRGRAVEALAGAIRQASRAGTLASEDDLRAVLAATGFPGAEGGAEPRPGEPGTGLGTAEPGEPGQPGESGHSGEGGLSGLLAETLARNADLAALASITGRVLYHAPALLSRTYAAILDRKGSPLILLAEEIRRNSSEYPRPVPVDLFEAEPFALTPEQIEAALAAMAENPDYRDITFTITSTGAVYLFSTRHLERPYAAFLAERADVGLAQNP